MKVKLPTNYKIEYPKENKDYYASPYNKVIRKLLFDASRGYCMYCGRKIVIDNEDFGHLEHSVDKGGNIKQDINQDQVLRHCKFNMAIACPKCNLVYKKKIEKIDVSKWKNKKCPKQCEKTCDDYYEMREEYTKHNQMLLQPLGYDKAGVFCSVEYDLFLQLYKPGSEIDDSGMKFLIGNHIERFDLNGDRFSYVLLDICENIVDLQYMGVNDIRKVMEFLERQRYENIIGPLFIEYLKNHFLSSGKKIEHLYEFCRLMIMLDAVV